MTERIKVREQTDVISRYSTYTRDELIQALNYEIEKIPEELRESIRFEVGTESYPYEETEYPKLFMNWERPETDKEMDKRIALEKQRKKVSEDYERQEFKRLQKKFGGKK